jgi:hypothetical protein
MDSQCNYPPEDSHRGAGVAAGFRAAGERGFPDVAPTVCPGRGPFATKPDAWPGAFADRDTDSFSAIALAFSAVAHGATAEKLVQHGDMGST